MQIVELNLNSYNFYCPITGEQIMKEGEEFNEDASSFVGYWVNQAFDEPCISVDKFKEEWEEFFEKKQEEVDEDDEADEIECLEEFLTEYDKGNYLCFKISIDEMACGPISTTVWVILDLDTEV